MSASITAEPNYPGKALNPVTFSVTTTLTDDSVWIRCYIYVETTPYSNTWDAVGMVEQLCKSQKAVIHVGNRLKSKLGYDSPDPGGDQVVVAEQVCRRFKLEFFEYLTTDLELINEYYQTTGSAAYYDIDELTNGQDYLIVMDTNSSEVKIQAGATEIDATVPDNYLIATGDGNVGGEYHREVSPTAASYDEIKVPSGVKLKVYKWVNKRAHVEPAAIQSGLLGGISVELLHKPIPAPAAPTSLTATAASSSQIDLAWTDNSDNEGGFTIEGSDDGITFSHLATVGANVTSYSETVLTEGTTRYYRVKATNGGKSSAWSNTANATTFIPFIFTVNTANSGVSTSTQFKLPLISSGTYDFTINWGDGNSDTITSYNQSEITHTYSTSGTYSPEIEGQLLGWAFNNGGDKLKITQISKWGNWQSNGAVNVLTQSACFFGCVNLDITATDNPDFSQATSVWACFNGCTSLSSNSNYNNWDMSTITEFRTCWKNSNFNNDINNWDVSNGTTFHEMFSGNSSFNSSCAGWDINGTIEAMFLNASAFTGIGLNTWNVDGATGNFNDTFEGTAMNSDISGWDPSGITGGWRHVFKDTSFNQDISGWTSISVGGGQGAFEGNTSFNQNLPNWTIRNNCSRMFYGCTAYTGQGLSTWTIDSSVNSMANMLDNTNISSATFDAILIAWAAQGSGLPTGITLGALGLTRTSASDAAYTTLTTTYSWTINT